MPPKRVRLSAKSKNTNQTLLPGAQPPSNRSNNDIPTIPLHLDPALTRAAPGTLQPKDPKRWAWSWQHMPDENPETRYYHEITGIPEWRCAYCAKRWATSGGTAKVNEHLIEDHGLFPNAPRGTVIQGQVGYTQQSIADGLKRQVDLAEDFKFKRRKMGGGDGSSIDPNMLEIYFTRYATSMFSYVPLRLICFID